VNPIAALKKDDLTVFNEIYRSHHEKIYFFMLHKTKSPFIAEETTQLAFIKLWEYRSRLSEDLPLNVQLFRIARTTMIDLLRKENSYSAKVIRLREKVLSPVDEVWETLSEKELQRQLSHVLEEMPRMRRKVFEMSRFGGMTCQQIAHELSLSSRTVEAHIFQATRQIRHYLGLMTVMAAISLLP
jgi:RNA polymerase sigma factor (sigma-70 family)